MPQTRDFNAKQFYSDEVFERRYKNVQIQTGRFDDDDVDDSGSVMVQKMLRAATMTVMMTNIKMTTTIMIKTIMMMTMTMTFLQLLSKPLLVSSPIIMISVFYGTYVLRILLTG